MGTTNKIIEVKGIKLTPKMIDLIADYQKDNCEELDFQCETITELICDLCGILHALNKPEEEQVLDAVIVLNSLRNFFKELYPK